MTTVAPAPATPASPSRSRRRIGLRRTARIEFPAIEIVGGLISPAILDRIAALQAPGQTEESYAIPPGLKLRDEAARAFRIAEALWARFAATPNAERFVAELLRQCFGFTLSAVAPATIGDRTFPIGHAGLDDRVPVVIAPAAGEGATRAGIDESLAQFADDSRKRSATLLLQEYLNASEAVLWGLASDGSVLRLMRDNASLTRPAWIEADLAKIFGEGLFADFTALWLLIHASRFTGAAPSDCALERWREDGRKQGVTAREKLAANVEAALVELGQGFIEHPANKGLRDALSLGTLSKQAYYEELLRLVYRLIFLFAAEDRDLLHPSETAGDVRGLYAEGYGLGRLRERCLHRSSWDKHADSWDAMKIVFAALEKGEPRLALPALGGLFQRGELPHLGTARIANRRFLAAIWRLSWLRPDGAALVRVNWRDMETEELGSVYESLLELTPAVDAGAGSFAFAGETTGGHARKTTGSYYTPDALVKLLLDTTLDPVLDAAEARGGEAEILKLSIIDPACGSGHFLLGAARRAAERIAKLRAPGAPSRAEFQRALREVVSHCIYGVDRNPMAVDLCKVALWIEAVEPGKPLTFLDARIRCGDSLIGVFDIANLKGGITDAAYAPLSGDAKEVARAYAVLNREQRDGQAQSGLFSAFSAPRALIEAANGVQQMPEDSLADVAAKRAAYNRLHGPGAWQQLKLACDLYVMAFFAPKIGKVPQHADVLKSTVPLTDHVWTAARGGSVYGALVAAADEVALRIRAFHWPLEFPEVFGRGGFDAVIGNPPWERIKLQEKEFFAPRDREIATARSAAERRRLILALATYPLGSAKRTLYEEFTFAKRDAEAASDFARESGRYPLTGGGDINTYALFAEAASNSSGDTGRAGLILPLGIATDSSTSRFFGDLVAKSRLVAVHGFENEGMIFPGIHHFLKFCILVLGNSPSQKTSFHFFIRNMGQLSDPERLYELTPSEISRMNPNTRTAPVFRARSDAELTARLYERAPVLVERRAESAGGDRNPCGVTFQTMFHMSNDSDQFKTAAELRGLGFERDGSVWVNPEGADRHVPLYEAKMIHQFDHRWATYETAGQIAEDARDSLLQEKVSPIFEAQPYYWVPEREVDLRAARVPPGLKSAVRDEDSNECLKALANWLIGYFWVAEGRHMLERELSELLGQRGWESVLKRKPAQWLIDNKLKASAVDIQRATPLNGHDIIHLRDSPKIGLTLAKGMIGRKRPRWLVGIRGITNVTNERTVIGSVFPLSAAGNSVQIWSTSADAWFVAALCANAASLCLDYVARQKVGGTNLNFFYVEQFPFFTPTDYTPAEAKYLTLRVLELTYTSHSLGLWAEDLGHTGLPFAWNEDRRALLRAELDAFFARKYGLTRDELRYVLDPADVKGPDYPSETFRVLKKNEIAKFGEYRTQRLVLEAFDHLTGV
jgi:hypothetical protein